MSERLKLIVAGMRKRYIGRYRPLSELPEKISKMTAYPTGETDLPALIREFFYTGRLILHWLVGTDSLIKQELVFYLLNTSLILLIISPLTAVCYPVLPDPTDIHKTILTAPFETLYIRRTTPTPIRITAIQIHAKPQV